MVAIKRILDIVISLTILILISPLLLILALLVKFSSPGPILYRWPIVGQGGKPIRAYKFRSMVVNADELKASLEHANEMQGPAFKITNDPRITSVGRWMRRYSLDELPQLFTTFTGQMSLVGPRPPFGSEYQRFTDYQKQKMLIKPGITCLWQVGGRNNISNYDDWVKLDLEYMERWSLSLDFRILFNTVGAVVRGTGK